MAGGGGGCLAKVTLEWENLNLFGTPGWIHLTLGVNLPFTPDYLNLDNLAQDRFLLSRPYPWQA